MSHYKALTLHPITKEWKTADWLDDYFSHHHYGVRFEGETEVFDPDVTKIEKKTKEVDYLTPHAKPEDTTLNIPYYA